MSDESSTVNPTVVESYKEERLAELLHMYNQNVFNCDETGLPYKMLPDRMVAFSGETCTGGKHSKERLTVLVGTNMTGAEKLPVLVIGKAKRVCVFRGIKTLPVWYESNRKAWITEALFGEYLKKLDKKFVRERGVFFLRGQLRHTRCH